MNDIVMITGGIDYSMSCPSILVHIGNEWSWDNCRVMYMSGLKKCQGKFLDGKILGVAPPGYNLQIERFINNAHVATEFLEDLLCFDVGLEGCSMGSKGKVFHIAENVGQLKSTMYHQEISFTEYPPTDIKKFATGKGNAGKDLMVDAFIEETGVDLSLTIPVKRDAGPISDIVDSYWICKRRFLERKENGE